MKTVPFLICAFCLSIFLCGLASIWFPVIRLEHRNAAELTVIAVSPPRSCPGQYPVYMTVDDGTEFFLSCFGNKDAP